MAWKGLQHPNVLPLLGVTIVGYQFVMVSEWMTNGNVNHFLEEHPQANRLELVCSAPIPHFDFPLIAVARRHY
jgi:hypothetical protein